MIISSIYLWNLGRLEYKKCNSGKEEINKFMLENKIINVYDMDFINRLCALQYVEDVEKLYQASLLSHSLFTCFSDFTTTLWWTHTHSS